MGETLKELRELPDEELIKRHDAAAPHTMVGVQHYLQEIARRDATRQTETMIRLTKFIAFLTALIFVLTLANVYIVLMLCRE